MQKERYTRTIGAITAEELTILQQKRICVVGCGGLGGYLLELLARLGIRNLTAIDGDVFGESNLNRQLLCTEENIGEYKVNAAQFRITKVNSEIALKTLHVFITEENACTLLKDHDVIIDALDNVSSRLIAEEAAEKLAIPLVHGAIEGWLAQIAVIMPGDRLLKQLYGTSSLPPPPVPSFTPAFCASMQVAETVKLLLGKDTLPRGRLLMIDLNNYSINSVDFTLIEKPARVLQLTRYTVKGEKGEAVQNTELIEGQGMEGDFHAIGGDRQISLMYHEDKKIIDSEAGLCLKRFKENILIEQTPPASIATGTRIVIGKAVLEISDSSHQCYKECPHYKSGQKCVLAERKLFAKVIKSGTVQTGDTIEKENS